MDDSAFSPLLAHVCVHDRSEEPAFWVILYADFDDSVFLPLG